MPGIMLMKPPAMIAIMVENKPPKIIMMAPTRDKANAAVGFSPKAFSPVIGFSYLYIKLTTYIQIHFWSQILG